MDGCVFCVIIAGRSPASVVCRGYANMPDRETLEVTAKRIRDVL